MTHPLLGMKSHNAPVSHTVSKEHSAATLKAVDGQDWPNPRDCQKRLLPGHLVYGRKRPDNPDSNRDRDYRDVSFFQLCFS